MKISIVTISLNQGQFLERAIQSVLDQKDVTLEYIIVDAGSTDDSRQIIQRYEDQFARVILEGDRGPADGLNKGFSFATGELFAYLNADDFYLPGALKRAIDAATRFPQAGAIVGNGIVVDIVEKELYRVCSTRFTPFAYVHGAAFALQQSTFYRRDAFRKVSGFNVENQTCWDGEILLDIALNNFNVQPFKDSIGAFRLYDDSITGSGRLQNHYRTDIERIFQKVMGRQRNLLDRYLVGPAVRTTAHLSSPRALVWKIYKKIMSVRTGLSRMG